MTLEVFRCKSYGEVNLLECKNCCRTKGSAYSPRARDNESVSGSRPGIIG